MLACRLTRRSVRKVSLGTQARLIFDRPCALVEAPELLRDAAADLTSRLGGTAHQMVTAAGNPEVKDAAGQHLCRHKWRIRLGGRELALSLSAHKQVGGNRPYLWIQGNMLLVRRVAYMFKALDRGESTGGAECRGCLLRGDLRHVGELWGCTVRWLRRGEVCLRRFSVGTRFGYAKFGGIHCCSCSGYHRPHDSLSPDSGVVFTCIPSRGSCPPSPSHQEAFVRAVSWCWRFY